MASDHTDVQQMQLQLQGSPLNVDAELAQLASDLQDVTETRISSLESSMSKVQSNVLDINAKLDLLVRSSLAQQGNKDDHLVRPGSQPAPPGDQLAAPHQGLNLTSNGAGFDPDSAAMELDTVPASPARRDVANPDTLSGATPEADDAIADIAFEGDEETGPDVMPSLANYISQCTQKRIDRDHLSTLRQRCLRPSNCTPLIVPKVNPGIWKELDRSYRTRDIHLQNTQELLGKGLTAVVLAKDKLLKTTGQTGHGIDQSHEVNSLLSTALAVLGNAFLDMSQRRRETMRPGINRRYQSLCNQSVPITQQLFGDNIQEAIKEINDMAKLSKSINPPSTGRFHPYPPQERRPNHGSNSQSSGGNRPLNFRGRPAPFKGQSRQSSYNRQRAQRSSRPSQPQ